MKRAAHDTTIRQSILFSLTAVILSALCLTGFIFYTAYSQKSDELIEEHSQEINKQIVYNYENYINSVIETANYIQYIITNLDVGGSYPYLEDQFLLNTEIKKDVVSIFLFDQDGELVLGSHSSDIQDEMIISAPWFTSALEEQLIFHFFAENKQSLLPDNAEEVISVSRYISYTEEGIDRTGVLLLELNTRTLVELAEKTNLGPEGHMFIIDDSDRLVDTLGLPVDRELERSAQIAVESYYGGHSSVIDERSMYMTISPLSNTRWRIVIVNDVDETAQDKRRMLGILLIITFASIAASVIISLLVSRRIADPLNTLKRSMIRIEQGKFHSKVEVSGQREVVQLSETFNTMIDTIRSLMDRILAEQRDKRKTELRALQNQINPHFLYNTLDSIIWLAENDRSDDVVSTVVALAKFFRISISGGENFITVEDEISHVSNYLTIQKIRYQNKFEYRFDIANDIYQEEVMKLIMQPLVENAINHGIGDEQETITIRGYREQELLVFEVENSGYGITAEQIQEIEEKMKGDIRTKSVGLRNVFLRLQLYYGKAADLRVRSVLDESTTFQVRIPLAKRHNGRMEVRS